MSASNNSLSDGTIYHPIGAIRLMSPAEERTARRSATGTVMNRSRTSAPFKRAIDVLRRFARVWVEAQEHRSGL